MNSRNTVIIVVGIIIFILSFLVNSQPSSAIMWLLGVILVALGLYFEEKAKKIE